jgi:hypothetical protein
MGRAAIAALLAVLVLLSAPALTRAADEPAVPAAAAVQYRIVAAQYARGELLDSWEYTVADTPEMRGVQLCCARPLTVAGRTRRMPNRLLVVLAPSVADDDCWATLKPQLADDVLPPLRSASLGGWRLTWYFPAADSVSFAITRIDVDGEQLLHHLSLPN